MSKPLKITVTIVSVVIAVGLIGFRHEERRPNQRMNQYWAVRSLDIWTFYGAEVYARNELAVYDMSGKTTKDLPEPISPIEIQIRRFGEVIEGGSQYNLGEDNYDDEGCMDYIYWALGTSLDASHRVEATAVFSRDLGRYPQTSELKDTLLSDSDEVVKSHMLSNLAASD